MKRALPLLLALIAALALTSHDVSAKARTLRITMSGGDLSAPIDIVEPSALRAFTLRVEGFIVDWTRGPALAAPDRARRYDVTFHVSPVRSGEARTFRVVYAYDTAVGQGYVFLPNTDHRPDGAAYQWFFATRLWDELARSLRPVTSAERVSRELSIGGRFRRASARRHAIRISP